MKTKTILSLLLACGLSFAASAAKQMNIIGTDGTTTDSYTRSEVKEVKFVKDGDTKKVKVVKTDASEKSYDRSSVKEITFTAE